MRKEFAEKAILYHFFNPDDKRICYFFGFFWLENQAPKNKYVKAKTRL
jgi:hypothetical protein